MVSHIGGLVTAFEEVFLEQQVITKLNAARRAGEPLYYSFQDRCAASGCSGLLSSWELDQTSAKRPRLASTSTPRERIALLRASGVSAGSPALRHPADLAVEAGLRTMLASVSGSWSSYASGLRSWALFIDALFPFTPHIPAQWPMLAAYGSIFANPDTLGRYLSHLRLAHRLLRAESSAIDELASSLRRGPRRHFVPKPRPVVSRADLERLVDLAVLRLSLIHI